MVFVIGYFLVLVWLWNYVFGGYTHYFEDTFIMGIIVIIYSLILLFKQDRIRATLKFNKKGIIANLFIVIGVLPSLTCVTLYKYKDLLNKHNDRILSGAGNTFAGTLLLWLLLFIIPFLIVFVPWMLISTMNTINLKILLKHKNNKKNKSLDKLQERISDLLEDKIENESIHLNNLDETVGYKFNRKLIPTEYKSEQVYLNNDEKYKYYMSISKNVDNLCNKKFKDNIANKTSKINLLISKIQNSNIRTSKEVKAYINQINDKINFFNYYLDKRVDFIESDYNGCKSGQEGEANVNKELNQYGNIINLENIRLEIPDNEGRLQSIENDNILLTVNGIFLLEVKNFGDVGNYDIIIEKDGRWLKKFRNSNVIKPLSNVTKQNNRHIAYFNKFINTALNNGLNDYIEAKGIIVIANEKVTITNYNDNQAVFRESEIYAYIKSHKKELDEDKIEIIKNLLLDNNLPPKKYPVYKLIDEVYENTRLFDVFCNNCIEVLNCLEDINKEHIQIISKIEEAY